MTVTLLGKIGLLALLFWLGLRWFERTMMYFPDPQLIANPKQVGLPFEEVWLRTEDGKKINAWWVPAARDGAPVVLLSHGNAGNISHRLDKIGRLHRLGLSVFIYDYRSYGKSPGWPSEKGTYWDAEAAYAYLVQDRNVPVNRILLYGESLGCAVAIQLALEHDVAGVILESPFTSMIAMANRLLPNLPARLMVLNRYDNLAKIARVKSPLLFLHSPQDEIVPFEMGKTLFEAAAAPKDFISLVGGHNEGYLDSGDLYLKAIATFLKRHTIKPGRPLKAEAGERA